MYLVFHLYQQQRANSPGHRLPGSTLDIRKIFLEALFLLFPRVETFSSIIHTAFEQK